MSPIPKIVNQPRFNPSGTLTQNGFFFNAAELYKQGKQKAEIVRVYEKLHRGIWVFNGVCPSHGHSQSKYVMHCMGRPYDHICKVFNEIERLSNIEKNEISVPQDITRYL